MFENTKQRLRARERREEKEKEKRSKKQEAKRKEERKTKNKTKRGTYEKKPEKKMLMRMERREQEDTTKERLVQCAGGSQLNLESPNAYRGEWNLRHSWGQPGRQHEGKTASNATVPSLTRWRPGRQQERMTDIYSTTVQSLTCCYPLLCQEICPQCRAPLVEKDLVRCRLADDALVRLVCYTLLQLGKGAPGLAFPLRLSLFFHSSLSLSICLSASLHLFPSLFRPLVV